MLAAVCRKTISRKIDFLRKKSLHRPCFFSDWRVSWFRHPGKIWAISVLRNIFEKNRKGAKSGQKVFTACRRGLKVCEQEIRPRKLEFKTLIKCVGGIKSCRSTACHLSWSRTNRFITISRPHFSNPRLQAVKTFWSSSNFKLDYLRPLMTTSDL